MCYREGDGELMLWCCGVVVWLLVVPAQPHQ